MFGHVHLVVGDRTIKVKRMDLSSCVGLLIEAPVEIADRVVVPFSDSLQESRQIESIPFGIEVDTKAESGRGVADDLQVPRLIDRGSFGDTLVAILIDVFGPTIYNL